MCVILVSSLNNPCCAKCHHGRERAFVYGKWVWMCAYVVLRMNLHNVCVCFYVSGWIPSVRLFSAAVLAFYLSVSLLFAPRSHTFVDFSSSTVCPVCSAPLARFSYCFFFARWHRIRTSDSPLGFVIVNAARCHKITEQMNIQKIVIKRFDKHILLLLNEFPKLKRVKSSAALNIEFLTSQWFITSFLWELSQLEMLDLHNAFGVWRICRMLYATDAYPFTSCFF